MHRNPLPARECRCGDGRIFNGEGGCSKCGRTIVATCPESGVMVPECGCRRCNRLMVARHAPGLLP